MDNEAQVVAQLKAAIPEVKHEEPNPVVQNSAVDTSSNNLPLENMLIKQQLFDYFNVGTGTRQSAETQAQLQAVMDWARENTSGTEAADILNAIMHQESLMGIKLKEDRLFRLYKFAKLNQQRLFVENQMKVLYA